MMVELPSEYLRKCVDKLRGIDSSLADLVQDAPSGELVVAGGFVRSVCGSEAVTDIDVFVADSGKAYGYADDLGARYGRFVRHETPRALTLHRADGPPVQFVRGWRFGSPAELVGKFDFTIARAAFWEEKGWKSVADARFLPDVLGKRLIYCSPEREECAGDALLRMLKFVRRGYRTRAQDVAAVVARLVRGTCQLTGDIDARLEDLLTEARKSSDSDSSTDLPVTFYHA